MSGSVALPLLPTMERPDAVKRALIEWMTG